jgi:DNA-binding transcriptional ArsR family regulator
MVYFEREAGLDTTFRALADPTRRAMLEQLASGERTIGELASGFAMTLPAVSKHVRVLERAGLADVRREGRSRRCALVAAPMRDAAAWMERYRSYWEASLDRLARYLDETQEEEAQWRKRHREPRSGSKSGAGSRRRGSGSTGRGRKRKH